MRDHVGRRTIPVDQSIHWKPIRDPHYVVASLQPAAGGHRQIFVRQRVLSRIEALVRAHGSRAVGLTIGQFYRCPVTDAEYLEIEACVELDVRGHEANVMATVAEALATRHSKHRERVLGWYRGVPVVNPNPSQEAVAIHGALFTQPWQSTLLVSETSGKSGGAFFLHDRTNARWFHAPFYELLDKAPPSSQPKLTVVSWPDYMTTDAVVLAARDVHAVTESPPGRSTKRDNREGLFAWRGERAVELLFTSAADIAPPADTPGDPVATRDALVRSDARSNPHAPVAKQPKRGLADRFAHDRDSPIPHRAGGSTDDLSVVDDRDRRPVASDRRTVADGEDTTLETDPSRFIEIARNEGFFIAARFDTTTESEPRETLWVLNEPYSGMLLAVAVTDTAVVDATLHYNLQTDDVGLRKVPFPEHRDPESKTIYVRETCVESLRARCRRLRATNALLREWKVTPAISLLTPGEWESLAPLDGRVDGGITTVNGINAARIAELPAGIRSQLHIETPGSHT